MIGSATSTQLQCSYQGCRTSNVVDQKMIQCSRCALGAYCTPACRSADWPSHRTACIKEVQSQVIQGMRAMLDKNRAAASATNGLPMVCRPYYVAITSKDPDYFRREKQILEDENRCYTLLLQKISYLSHFAETQQWAASKRELFKGFLRSNESCQSLCDERIHEFEGTSSSLL